MCYVPGQRLERRGVHHADSEGWQCSSVTSVRSASTDPLAFPWLCLSGSCLHAALDPLAPRPLAGAFSIRPHLGPRTATRRPLEVARSTRLPPRASLASPQGRPLPPRRTSALSSQRLLADTMRTLIPGREANAALAPRSCASRSHDSRHLCPCPREESIPPPTVRLQGLLYRGSKLRAGQPGAPTTNSK